MPDNARFETSVVEPWAGGWNMQHVGRTKKWELREPGAGLGFGIGEECLRPCLPIGTPGSVPSSSPTPTEHGVDLINISRRPGARRREFFRHHESHIVAAPRHEIPLGSGVGGRTPGTNMERIWLYRKFSIGGGKIGPRIHGMDGGQPTVPVGQLQRDRQSRGYSGYRWGKIRWPGLRRGKAR